MDPPDDPILDLSQSDESELKPSEEQTNTFTIDELKGMLNSNSVSKLEKQNSPQNNSLLSKYMI